MNVNKCLVSLSQPSERLLMISWRKEKKEIIAEVTCPVQIDILPLTMIYCTNSNTEHEWVDPENDQ